MDVRVSVTGIKTSASTDDQGIASMTLMPVDWQIALNIPEGYEPSSITLVKMSGGGTALPSLLVAHSPEPDSVWHFEIGLMSD